MPKSTTALALTTYDHAKQSLALCESVDECKDWADKSAALAVYAHKAHSYELELHARKIRARSVRRLGEISAKLEKGKPGRHMDIGSSTGTYISKIAVLAEAGVSKSQAHQAEKIAAVPEDRFERMVESSVPRDLTLAALSNPRGVRDAQQPDSVDDWFTPLVIIEAARTVLGTIDFDPASNPAANDVVDAAAYAHADALDTAWPSGAKIWCNPPFRLKRPFAERLVAHDGPTLCLFPTAATEVAWFQALIEESLVVCWHRGRMKFWRGDETSSSMSGSAVFGIRLSPSSVKRFAAAFGGHGVITYRHAP